MIGDIAEFNGRKYRVTTKEVGDVQPGDLLVGSGGQPTVCVGKSETHIPEKQYKITLSNGEAYPSGDHLWEVHIDHPEIQRLIAFYVDNFDSFAQLPKDGQDVVLSLMGPRLYDQQRDMYYTETRDLERFFASMKETGPKTSFIVNTETLKKLYDNNIPFFLTNIYGDRVTVLSIDDIIPEESQCLFVDADDSLFALDNGTLTHNSVMQRNVILSCLMRPKQWMLCIIDMKKVEGAMWRKYGVPVATTYEDASILLSWAQTTMMERFEELEKRGLNNWKDMPEDKRGQAIMINVDEISELLAPIKGKSEESKAQAELQGECQQAIESIARLGRAAQVHLIIAGQRPDSDVVSMQIRQNCPTRLAAGALPGTIAQMVFEGDASFASTLPSKPQGRCAMKIHSATPNKFQGFFASEDWLDSYLEEKNLPSNIYGSALMVEEYEKNKREVEAKKLEESGGTKTMTRNEALDEWDSDLDDLIDANFEE